jgi:Bacteriophage tail sheath protein
LITTAAADRWYRDALASGLVSAHNDGVREKLALLAKAINDTPGMPARAEVWGYHLALIPKTGTINSTVAITTGNSGGGGTNIGGSFTVNVKQYSLGNVGTSTFQNGAGAVGTDDDGNPPNVADYVGSALDHTGFNALDKVDLFNLMVLPGDRDVPESVYIQLVGPASIYCQQHRAFLVMDPPDSWTNGDLPAADATDVNALRGLVVKDYSAVFYPRVQYSDLGLKKFIGPSGMIAGLMARTDAQRGVWKAPAGTEADLRGVLDVEVNLTDLENGVLNKLGVSCIRKFPSGIVNWGARTMDGSDDIGSEWKYIPIRRLALFLEESLYRGTKWVVFEPNDEPLWAKIRLNLNAFMLGLFRQGAFQGTTPDKAFFVKCDAETTTQNDRNLGIVNIEVGFAPLKPAEFVIIKIQQIAGDLT